MATLKLNPMGKDATTKQNKVVPQAHYAKTIMSYYVILVYFG